MASYPTSVVVYSTKVDDQVIEPEHINDLQAEVVAMAGGLLNGLAHDLKFTDATYDIGKSGATRPRDLFLSRNATIGGTLTVTGVPSFPATTITLRGVTYTLPSADGAANAVLTTNGSAALSWAHPAMTLIAAGTGTTTNAAAENFFTAAIPGLTSKDTIKVIYSLESVTQQTANPFFCNSTDSNVELCKTNGGNALTTANSVMLGEAEIRMSPASSTRIFSRDRALRGGDGANEEVSDNGITTFTTAWTGSWTLAVRHGGVTAGGTLHYSVAVYKIAGQ
jgi:hypothetical protein